MATFSRVKIKHATCGRMLVALAYVLQDKKVTFDGVRVETGHNCTPYTSYLEMMATKQSFRKTDGVNFLHYVHSFSDKENITLWQANEIARELAEKLFPDNECVIATHNDTDNLHSHIIVNSVSFKNRKKLHMSPTSLQEQRQVNDEICRAHGFSVLEPYDSQKKKKRLTPGEYRAAMRDESWKFRLIKAIDEALEYSPDNESFILNMEYEGYEVRWDDTHKYILFTTPEGKKCRDRSLHDETYLKENLEKYARDNGFTNVRFMYDDGYSGTNFNRPAWNEVLKMIENGEVKTLIVKDLSRLGREYLQVGYYTEIYFPQRGVCFIAVNDGVDSLYSESNDFTPMRNYFNELYAKDSSKKVRVVKRAQAERGELLGGRPPYGYCRDEKVRKGIVPDEEAAAVVKRIFSLCAEGKGPNQIARLLTKEQFLNPTNYYYQKHGKSHASLDTTSPFRWSSSSVTGILDNKTYLGHMAGLRATTLSYKNKKLIRHPESEQILVENVHEPLITQQQWDIVQDVRKHKKRTPKQMEEPNMFSGLVYCADCKKTMVLHRAHTMKATYNNFKCYTYNKRGKEVCSAHYLREQDLVKIVLDDLRRVTYFARQKERMFAEYINQKNSLELRREINTVQKELDTMRRRNTELTALFKRLYEDNVLGRITSEQFRILSGDYNAEQKELNIVIPAKEARLEKLKASTANVEAFIEKAKRYTDISELTPEILRLFIERIEIGERSERYSRTAEQDIRIVYRDVGVMDSVEPVESGEQEFEELTDEQAEGEQKTA